MTASVEHTRAVLVGIDRYATGPDWNLRGPVLDACRFAEWLVARGVPRENITLLLGIQDADVALAEQLAGVPFRDATQSNVRDALTEDLYGSTSDLLIIYWGGHGVVDEREARRLFCADATEWDKRNLDLSGLLTVMRSSLYEGHAHQLVFVDACTTAAAGRRWKASLPHDRLPTGTLAAHVDQHVLFAAGPGQIAHDDNARRTGLFSDALRSVLLRCPHSTWPPDPTFLSDEVNHAFQRMREEGRTRQVPASLWFRSGASEQVLFSTDVGASGVTSAAIGQQVLKTTEATALREVLHGVALTQPFHPHYGEAVRDLVGMPPCPDDLWHAVQALRRAMAPEALFRFLVRLADTADRATAEQLWNWMRTTAPRWSVDVDELLALQSELRRTVLLVNVESALVGTGYDVTIWWYVGGEGRQVMSTTEPCTLRELGHHLGRLLQQTIGVTPPPMVEFELPTDMLLTAVEAVPVEWSDHERTLGELCPVVVRPATVDVEPGVVDAWLRRWRSLLAEGDRYRRQAVLILPVAELPGTDVDEDVVCLGLYGFADQRDLTAALDAAFAAGMPIVLMHRPTPARPLDDSAVTSLLGGRAPRSLPDVVHRQRRNARDRRAPIDHPGRDVVLVWRDPTRVRPTMTWAPPA